MNLTPVDARSIDCTKSKAPLCRCMFIKICKSTINVMQVIIKLVNNDERSPTGLHGVSVPIEKLVYTYSGFNVSA